MWDNMLSSVGTENREQSVVTRCTIVVVEQNIEAQSVREHRYGGNERLGFEVLLCDGVSMPKEM